MQNSVPTAFGMLFCIWYGDDNAPTNIPNLDNAPTNIPIEDDPCPPPLPPRLPKVSNVSRDAILDGEDNKEISITSQKSKPNGKLGHSDLQSNHNALLLGANLNRPQFIHSPRIEKRDNGSLREVKRELEEQWDKSISLQQPTTHEAESGAPPIVYSPTPLWGTRDLESSSSSWDWSQYAIAAIAGGATEEDSISAELLPPGLFSSPRAGKIRSKSKSENKVVMETRDTDTKVETRDTDTQTEDEDGILHRAR